MSRYAPWYVIAWRLIWWLPVQALRVALCITVAAGWGGSDAHRMWEGTQ